MGPSAYFVATRSTQVISESRNSNSSGINSFSSLSAIYSSPKISSNSFTFSTNLFLWVKRPGWILRWWGLCGFSIPIPKYISILKSHTIGEWSVGNTALNSSILMKDINESKLYVTAIVSIQTLTFLCVFFRCFNGMSCITENKSYSPVSKKNSLILGDAKSWFKSPIRITSCISSLPLMYCARSNKHCSLCSAGGLHLPNATLY